jgi:hypothetical protein
VHEHVHVHLDELRLIVDVDLDVDEHVMGLPECHRPLNEPSANSASDATCP